MHKKAFLIIILPVFGICFILAASCRDVNSSGSIDIIDALMTAQYYVGLDPQPCNVSAADVSGDGSINISDALQTAQYFVGLITILLGCEQPPASPTPGSVTHEMQVEDAARDDASVDNQHSEYTGNGKEIYFFI